MEQINVTDFRQNLPSFLQRVAEGERFQITVRGKVVARLESDVDEAERAWARILSCRPGSVVGDVMTPIESDWTADLDNL